MPLDITQEDFLTPAQVATLKEHCRRMARAAGSEEPSRASRNWAILHLALDTGLRVSEICALRLRDLVLDGNTASLVVRDGKGHKKRGVHVGDALRGHLVDFLAQREKTTGPADPQEPLFLSSRGKGPLTRTAVFRIFKQEARRAGLPARFSIHSCRHTYASLLYRASKYNIRLVQKELGHRSIQTTQIYADVLSEDATLAVNSLPQ